MKGMKCFYERSQHVVIGIVFALIAFIFLGLGVTVLPVLGLFLALPILGLAIYFFSHPLEGECGRSG
jgi:hypothetical protein